MHYFRDLTEISDSHVDYIEQAVLASAAEAQGDSTPYAWRACDMATTPPRPGSWVVLLQFRN